MMAPTRGPIQKTWGWGWGEKEKALASAWTRCCYPG